MSLIRPLSGRKPTISLPKGAIDTQMHAYLPGYPALPGGPGLPAGDLPTPEQYRQRHSAADLEARAEASEALGQ